MDDVFRAARTWTCAAGIQDELGARQSLAEIIVWPRPQLEGYALGAEGAEALPGRSLELELDGVFQQGVLAVAAGRGSRRGWSPPCDWTFVADGELALDLGPVSRAGLAASISFQSSALSRPWSWRSQQNVPMPLWVSAMLYKSLFRSNCLAFQASRPAWAPAGPQAPPYR